MDLDWGLPPYPPGAGPKETAPPRVVVDRGQ
jgi:hypothetical protein